MNKQEILATLLSVLEFLEAQQINVGLYSTLVTPKDVQRSLEKSSIGEERELGIQFSDEQLAETLQQLKMQREVIEWKPGYFRSRIAETVRLLRLVRQRFWRQRTRKDMFNNAPLLIEDIRVEFRRRKRPIWNKSLHEEIPNIISNDIQDAFERSLPFQSISAFQARGINEIFFCAHKGNIENLSFLVSGDTGAGKTEAFFFPLLLDIANEDTRTRPSPGVRAVLVYPRIRLARNQLRRLLNYTTRFQDCGGPRITFGIQNGDVPDKGEDIRNKNWEKRDENGRIFYRVGMLEGCVQCGDGQYWVDSQDTTLDSGFPRLECHKCHHVISSLCLTHEALKQVAPDILIITDVSLNQWLAREDYSHLWGLWEKDALHPNKEPTLPPRFLVLDEVHLYEQLKGAHIARLIKRFQARVQLVYVHRGQPHHHPLVIGVSATLQDELTFLAKLLDVTENAGPIHRGQLRCIKPAEHELQSTFGRERYIFIYPRNLSPTPNRPDYRVNDQAAAIQIIMTTVHNLMIQEVDKPWRALAFFDSLNDLRQFRHDYDSPSAGHYDPTGRNRLPPANQDELWRIRTDRQKKEQSGKTAVVEGCGSCAERAANASLYRCPHFQDGDCWIFAHFYGCNRSLNVADSVYAGSKDASALDKKDLIPTSPSLEVGYDDDAIQLVYQHKAPSNSASFIQRRGRAGRKPDDSPVVVTLLWPYRRDDAFYFYHPEALYAPTFDDVPLNAGNFTVQKTHVLLAFFDLLACWRRQNLHNIRENPLIPDFTKAGKSSFLLSPTVVYGYNWAQHKYHPEQQVLYVTHTDRKVSRFTGKHLSNGYVKIDDNAITISGWLAMQEGLFSQVLKPAWEILSGSFETYITNSTIANAAFWSHYSNPFYRPILPSGEKKLPRYLLNTFGDARYHSSNDKDRSNWLKTYRHIDWMMQGNQEATTFTVHYPNPERDQPDELAERTVDVSFALTEFLPGNVSYRLRETNSIHWTPVPHDGESTFLYPLTEAENGSNEDKREFIPDITDIAGQPNSIFGISEYLYERFHNLRFMTIRRLRVETFSRPDITHSLKWYFVPNEKDENKGYAVDIDGDDPTVIKPSNAFRISRSSSARANSVIIPFAAKTHRSQNRYLSSPIDRMFSSIEGLLQEGSSLPGYYRVFYEMHIDIKGEKREHTTHLTRGFYPDASRLEKDQEGFPKPILVGYEMRTQGICFHLNLDLIHQTVDRIIDDDEDLRLLLRRNFAVYMTAPKSAEWELFIQTQLEWAEVVVDYWVQSVVPSCNDEPRLLSANVDLKPLMVYYRTHRIVHDNDVRDFEEFLSRTSTVFDDLNSILDIAFKKKQTFRDYVASVVIHSLSALLKNLMARLGGIGSDELVAYADLPILKRVDNSIAPRILIMDTVEGGSGGVAQAYDRLNVQDNNEGSLCWTLLTELGKCPIGDGEAFIRSVLTKASIEQITAVQAQIYESTNMSAETLDESVDHLLRVLSITPFSIDVKRMLGRILFREIEVSDIQKVNPALILRELFIIQASLEQSIPGVLDRRATILHAVTHLDSSNQPAITQLRDALMHAGVAAKELNREFAQQLLGMYNSACVDGCPVCLSTDSDIEHIYLAPRLNSRQTLKKLREVLMESLPKGASVADVGKHISQGTPAIIEADPGRLGNHLDPSMGIGVIPEVDDAGQLKNASTIVVNMANANDLVLNGSWERWSDKPVCTTKGRSVRSKAEYKIAVMLEQEDLLYEYEPRLPYINDEGDIGYIHPCFCIYANGLAAKGLYVEYWGRSEAEYLESRTLKEKVYHQVSDQQEVQLVYLSINDIEQDIYWEKIKIAIAGLKR